MKTLTIRGLNEQALGRITRQAKSRHSSVNKFVVEALQKIAFPGEPGKAREWHDLDGFFGSWSEAEAKRVLERRQPCRTIDAELWK